MLLGPKKPKPNQIKKIKTEKKKNSHKNWNFISLISNTNKKNDQKFITQQN